MNRRDLLLLLTAAATASPFASHAQPKTMPVVGYLGNQSPSQWATISAVAAVHQGLREAGYIEGRNLAIEYRWAESQFDRLPTLAADLVARKVDVIVAAGSLAITAAKAATSTIPIVFIGGGDLVAAGIVASLARPGGNLTGIRIFDEELNIKRLALLSELVPEAKVIAVLVSPPDPTSQLLVRYVRDPANAHGRQFLILDASTASEIDSAFTTLVQRRAGALVFAATPFFNSRREQIMALAARHAVPTIYQWREATDAGGLISYGPSYTGTWRQVGAHVGRVLAGADPATLPIEQPSRLELVINLRTAKALGLAVPLSILAQADEVIE